MLRNHTIEPGPTTVGNTSIARVYAGPREPRVWRDVTQKEPSFRRARGNQVAPATICATTATNRMRPGTVSRRTGTTHSVRSNLVTTYGAIDAPVAPPEGVEGPL